MKVKTNKYGPGHSKVIIKKDGDIIKTGCCCCYLDIRAVTAELPWYGFEKGICDPSAPPPVETYPDKFLEFNATGQGQKTWCGTFFNSQPNINWMQIDQKWKIDPFTGLTCYTGPKQSNVLRPCTTRVSCTEVSKVYNCGTIPAQNGCPEIVKEWSETISDTYTFEKLEQKVEQMLNRVSGDVWESIPAGSSGIVVNGSNNQSILTIAGCAGNRASFEYDEVEKKIKKTNLFVEFTRNTNYRIREKTQSSTDISGPFQATKGSRLTIEPPSEIGDYKEILIDQKERKTLQPFAINITHKGKKKKKNRDMGSTLYLSPDCKYYNKYKTTTTYEESVSHSLSLNKTNTSSSSTSSSNETHTHTRNENTQTTRTRGLAQVTDSQTKTISANFNKSTNQESYQWYFVNPSDPNNYEQIERHISTSSSTIAQTLNSNTWSESDRNWTKSTTDIYTKHWPSSAGSYNTSNNTSGAGYGGYPWSTAKNAFGVEFLIPKGWCAESMSWAVPEYDNIGTRTATQSLTLSVEDGISKATKVYSGVYSRAWTETQGAEVYARNHSTTFSSKDEVTYQFLVDGEFESAPDQDNNSFIALKFEDQYQQLEDDVDADLELSFTAEESPESIEYEHWLHYYTRETGSPDTDCPQVEFEAKNFKWTTSSTGGEMTETKSISVPAPTGEGTKEVLNIYYQVTKKLPE